MKSKLYKIGKIITVLILIIYTIIIMQKHGFGIDELDWTLRFIDGKSFIEIFKSLASYGYNLPLYYIILKLFDFFFHHNKFMLLLPSVFMAVIGCYYIYKTAKYHFEVKFAILVTFISVSSLFFFKQIACSLRPYSLLFMLSSMSYYYYLKKIETNNFANNLKFIIIITSLLFTHWYGAFLTFFYGITDIYLLFKKKAKFKYFVLYSIPFTLILLWLIYVLKVHIITFSEYWADPPKLLEILDLISQLLGLNFFSILILKFIMKSNGIENQKFKKCIKVKLTFYYIMIIFFAMIIYSNFINPYSTLWVNRYFIVFMPQISIITGFFIKTSIESINDSKVSETLKFIVIYIFFINFFANIFTTFYFSYIHPNAGNEMDYENIFNILKKDDDIYKDDTLIIFSYGKYWSQYYLFEMGEKLPSNVLIIDPHKYGNTNSENANISELEYVIKDSKKYYGKYEKEHDKIYQKVYVVELHRMITEDEINKIIDFEKYNFNYNKTTGIVKLCRSKE